jgi:hypothetical protein
MRLCPCSGASELHSSPIALPGLLSTLMLSSLARPTTPLNLAHSLVGKDFFLAFPRNRTFYFLTRYRWERRVRWRSEFYLGTMQTNVCDMHLLVLPMSLPWLPHPLFFILDLCAECRRFSARQTDLTGWGTVAWLMFRGFLAGCSVWSWRWGP